MTRPNRARRWVPLLILPLELGVLVAVLVGVELPAGVVIAVVVVVLAAVGFECLQYVHFYRRHRQTGLGPWPAGRAAMFSPVRC